MEKQVLAEDVSGSTQERAAVEATPPTAPATHDLDADDDEVAAAAAVAAAVFVAAFV